MKYDYNLLRRKKDEPVICKKSMRKDSIEDRNAFCAVFMIYYIRRC